MPNTSDAASNELKRKNPPGDENGPDPQMPKLLGASPGKAKDVEPKLDCKADEAHENEVGESQVTKAEDNKDTVSHDQVVKGGPMAVLEAMLPHLGPNQMSAILKRLELELRQSMLNVDAPKSDEDKLYETLVTRGIDGRPCLTNTGQATLCAYQNDIFDVEVQTKMASYMSTVSTRICKTQLDIKQHLTVVDGAALYLLELRKELESNLFAVGEVKNEVGIALSTVEALLAADTKDKAVRAAAEAKHQRELADKEAMHIKERKAMKKMFQDNLKLMFADIEDEADANAEANAEADADADAAAIAQAIA